MWLPSTERNKIFYNYKILRTKKVLLEEEFGAYGKLVTIF